MIGTRRWDRSGNGPGGRRRKRRSACLLPGGAAAPLDAKSLGWTTVSGRRARLVSFYDRTLPAWFAVALHPRSALPLELEMTAAAHFMHHRYTDFNRPLRIVPPA